VYESIKKNLKDFKIRFANENDADLILDFIKQLAIYEKRLNQVIATKADIKEVLFKRKIAEAVIGEYKGEPVSFAIFLYNFSTFIGKPGIYIEDLYVNPEIRGKGIGTIMFAFLAKLAIDRKCGTLEWSVLNWNEPSIKFYKKIGAEPKSEWTIYRITGHVLEELARLKDF
jgi:GNAT superfamily N-acetyltransferase